MKQVRPLFELSERLALLSEPVRLRLLRVLEGQELSVGEAARVVQLPQSTVSRHLKVLSEGGWLVRRSEGTASMYRLVQDDLEPTRRALWRTVREQVAGSKDLAEDDRRVRGVLADRRTDSQAFFGRVAGEWDALRGHLFGGEFTARALLGLLPRDWEVADLGCGTGNAAEYLAPLVERVIAVDRSEAMLSAARKRLEGQRNVRFVVGALERLPMPDASLDAVVCLLVLHHVEDVPAAVGQMRRVLRTQRGGGVALIVDMVEHEREEYRRLMGHRHLGFAVKGMEATLRHAGFGRVHTRVLPGDPQAKGPGLFVSVARI